MKVRSTRISSKWLKTRWLLNESSLASYIPSTKQLTKDSLQNMLDQYDTVYIKPIRGYGGQGIARVKRIDHHYEVQRDAKVKQIKSFNALFDHLKSIMKAKPYLVQQGINIQLANGQPFDLRVMVQKLPKGTWKSTGIFAKIGRKGKVVNNFQQGGSIGYFTKTLKQAGYSPSVISQMEAELEQLGERVGRCFDKKRNGVRELGLDVAIDRSDKLWILEVNTKPGIYPLKRLKDKTLYYSFLKYAKYYGRTR